MTHQLVTGGFWSLALFPLSLAYQVRVSVLLFITSPFTYYPSCTEKVQIRGRSDDSLNDTGALTLHIPHEGDYLAQVWTYSCFRDLKLDGVRAKF